MDRVVVGGACCCLGTPPGLYELIVGVNLWIYRVIAYVALLTDDYPPFHLDHGGSEPAAQRLLPSQSIADAGVHDRSSP